MKILYLTNGFPYPLTSGYLRHYHFIKELSRHHSITLASLVNETFTQEHADAMAPYTEQILPFSTSSQISKESLLQKSVRHFRRLTGQTPAVREMSQAIQTLMQQEQFDVVVFSGRDTFPIIREIKDIPVVADICDASTVRIRGRLRHSSLRSYPRLCFEYILTQRIEQEIVQSSQHVLFASARDRDVLVSSDSESATVIPNGVDLEFWKRTSPTRGRNTIIFTGAMNYRPNVDAAMVLIRDILPLVHRNIPDAELYIVGRDPIPELCKAGEQPGVTVTGFVDDVRPYLDKATVFAAPLRFGAGIQNKLLEAMAMELPIVASGLAIEGVKASEISVPPIEPAETPQQFADRICLELIEAETNSSPSADARRYVSDHFVWEKSGETLSDILAAVINSKPVHQEPTPCLQSR